MTIRKILFATTALVAVSVTVPTIAQAADHVLTGNSNWASHGGADGSHIDDAAAGDNVDVNGYFLTITNDGANDGSGDTDTFAVGDITDSDPGASGIEVTQDAGGGALDVTVASVDIGGDVTVQNNDGADEDLTMSVTGSFNADGVFVLINNDTDNGNSVEVEIGGNVTVGADMEIYSGDGASILTLNGATNTFSGNILMDDSGGGGAMVRFNGSVAQTVTGNIDGAVAGDGEVVIGNTHASGVTFEDQIGVAVDAVDTVTLEDDAGDVRATFKDDVATSNGIILGTGNGNTATVTFDTTANGDITIDGGLSGDAGSTANVVIAGTSDEVTANDEWTLNTLTVNAGMTFNASNDLTADDINLAGVGSTLVIDGLAGTIDANITGADGAQTIEINTGDFIGQAGNTINMGAGDDEIVVNSVTEIDADTLIGGAGTDTITMNTDATINSDISGFEELSVETAGTLLLTGNVTGGSIVLDVDGAAVEIDGGVVSSNIVGTTGAGEEQTVTVTSGTVSGDISLGDGDDTIEVDTSAEISGDIDGGADDDTMTLFDDFTTSGTITNVDLIDVAGNTLTVESAITNGGADYGNWGIDVFGGVLQFNEGGSFDGTIYDTDGGASVEFGADTNGGTFNLAGAIEDVDLNVVSGTVNTNGVDLGSDGALSSLTTAADATFDVEDSDVFVGGNLINNGTVRIGSAGMLDVGSHTTAGDFVFVVEDSSTFGHMASSADALITGANMSVDVGLGDLADGDELLIVDAANAVNGGAGQAATAVDDDSFLWNFQLADGADGALSGGSDNTDLYLIVSAANDLGDDVAEEGSNNDVVAEVLEGLIGDSDFTEIFESINSIDSQVELNEYLEKLLPASVSIPEISTQNFSLWAGSTVDAVVLEARAGDGSSGIATGNVGRGNRAWIQTFGQTANQDFHDGIDGYQANTYGVAAGWDTANAAEDTIVGLSLSYGNTSVDSDASANAQTDIDSYQLTLYGNHTFGNRAFVTLQGSYGMNNIDIVRFNAGALYGDYDARQYGVRAQVGRDYSMAGDMEITPSVTGNWMRMNPETYTETGPGVGALTVNGDDVTMADLGMSVESRWKKRSADGSVTQPSLNAGYRYDLVGDPAQATSNFVGGGATFTTSGMEPARHMFDVGAAVTYQATDGMEIRAAYDYAFKTDYEAHSGLVKAAFKF